MSLIHRCSDQPVRPKAAPAALAVPHVSPVGTYFSMDAHDRCAALFPRQRDVLVMLSKGLDQSQIAQALEISVHTVREHKQRIFKTLEVNSAVEAAVLAAKAGMV